MHYGKKFIANIKVHDMRRKNFSNFMIYFFHRNPREKMECFKLHEFSIMEMIHQKNPIKKLEIVLDWVFWAIFNQHF
jgi:hypothetical protein